MVRMMMDNVAALKSHYSPSPHAEPMQQLPYYVIPPLAPSMTPYSVTPQYVYCPSSPSGFEQLNDGPIFSAVPAQNHSHQYRYPPHNVIPNDTCENVMRQQMQPRFQRMQQGLQPYVTQHAPYPLYEIPEGTMLGQPAHYNGYPVYRVDDTGGVARVHSQTGAFKNQPSGLHHMNNHGVPISVPVDKHPQGQHPTFWVSGSRPYSSPAAQPGMRWKLVPVTDPDIEEPIGPSAHASLKATAPPLVLMPSPHGDNTSGNIHKPDSPPLELKLMPQTVDDGVLSSEDPYKQFLSLLLLDSEAKHQMKSEEESEVAILPKTMSKVAPANLVMPEKEVEAAIPKSVRIISVTDPPKKEDRVATTSTSKSSSAPKLKPIKLVPSLDFVKKRDSGHAAGPKEKQNTVDVNEGNAKSHQGCTCNYMKEKEVFAEKDGQKVSALKMDDEAGSKPEVVGKEKKLIADAETAARVIQSVHRGYVVRRCQPLKHLRDIARVKSLLNEYRTLASEQNFLEKCKDPIYRTKISEGILSLLLQLDVIQGVDPVIRDIRKHVSKEVLKLQSEVDAALNQITVSSRVVSKEHDQQNTKLGTLEDETEVVDKNLATSQEPYSIELSHNVKHHDGLASKGEEMLLSKSEEIANEIKPSEGPTGQLEECVEDLLRKLLNKLPNFESCKVLETVDVGEFLDTYDSALISEVVKRLSVFKEQQMNKNREKRRLNEHKSPIEPRALGHIDKREELVTLDTRCSDNNSDEVLNSNYLILDNVSGEKSSAADGEQKLLTFEVPVLPPSDLELQNLGETVASEFLDAVMTYSEDRNMNVVHSIAVSAENVPEGDQDVKSINATTSHEVPTGMDVFSDLEDCPDLVNIQDVEKRESVIPNESIGEATQLVTSLTNSEVITKEYFLKTFEVTDSDTESPTADAHRPEDDGEASQTLYRSDYESEKHSSTSVVDQPTFGGSEIPNHKITEDIDKHRTSELVAKEECSERSFLPMVQMVNEKTSELDSTASLADEEEVLDVQDIDLMIHDATPQLATSDGALDHPLEAVDNMFQETLLVHVKNTENEVDEVIDNNNTPEVANLVSGWLETEHSGSLCDDSLTCQDSCDIRSKLQSGMDDSAEVGSQVNESDPSNCDLELRLEITNSFEQCVVPQSVDIAAELRMSLHTNPSQKKRTEFTSPTSVLDPVITTTPTEDMKMLAKDSTGTMLDQDHTSKQPSSTPILEMQIRSAQNSSPVNAEEALQLQSAISNLQCLNNEGQYFLYDQSMQLESAISDLQSLNNTGQGFLNNLNPVENTQHANSLVCCPPSKRIAESEVCAPKPPSLSAEALHILKRGFGCPRDGSETPRASPSSCGSRSEFTLTQHLVEENMILKELLINVLKWSQWQSSATLSLHKMMEKLEHEVLDTKKSARRVGKGPKQCRNIKHFVKAKE